MKRPAFFIRDWTAQNQLLQDGVWKWSPFPVKIDCFRMGFGNGVDFLSTIPNKKWWTEEGFVDEGGEVVLKAMSQDGFLNRGQRQTFQSKCPCSNRGDLYLPLFVPLNKATAVRARAPRTPKTQNLSYRPGFTKIVGRCPKASQNFEEIVLGVVESK